MIGDTQSRKETPVKLVPLGYNSTASSDLDISAGSAFGDLADLMSMYSFGGSPAVQKQNAVRIPQPYSGEITELYLSFRLRLDDTEVGTRSMWVGYADALSSDSTELALMDEYTIKQAHESVTGTPDAYQAAAGGYIQFNRLNITPLLRKAVKGRGIYGLVFLFDQTPKTRYDTNNILYGGYGLEVFRMEGVARFKGVR